MITSVESRFTHELSQHNLRVTAARKTVFSLLHASEAPLTIKDIATRANDIDRASVYRTIDTFQSIGLISSILIKGRQHFELAAPFKAHHHHIICEVCGEVTSLHSPSLEKLIEQIASKKGYHLQSHTLELSGYCKNCT